MLQVAFVRCEDGQFRSAATVSMLFLARNQTMCPKVDLKIVKLQEYDFFSGGKRVPPFQRTAIHAVNVNILLSEITCLRWNHADDDETYTPVSLQCQLLTYFRFLGIDILFFNSATNVLCCI